MAVDGDDRDMAAVTAGDDLGTAADGDGDAVTAEGGVDRRLHRTSAVPYTVLPAAINKRVELKRNKLGTKL
ncbi:hypothetical protein ANCDUO_22974 [Ancylostoma duodenale]|uniref:Uncharacterized protein n=1 Tax=Ancylostoma duodenale TaxID=51022 RepID=A0A0C2FJP1_9BILA|nr:hypothetical protein ANCDUO_22974 [Ancylostoma duodenale]